MTLSKEGRKVWESPFHPCLYPPPMILKRDIELSGEPGAVFEINKPEDVSFMSKGTGITYGRWLVGQALSNPIGEVCGNAVEEAIAICNKLGEEGL